MTWGHPSAVTHLPVADVTYYGIHGMLNKARGLFSQDGSCEVVRTPLSLWTAVLHTCADKGFVIHMTSNHPEEFKPSNVSSHGEDVKGKAGWIIDLSGKLYGDNYVTFGLGRSHETTFLK